VRTRARADVVVRPAVEADVPALADMAEEFQTYINGLRQRGEAPEPAVLTTAAIRQHGFGADPWFHGLLAERAGNPVGYLLYTFGYYVTAATGAMVVADLFVREAVRGQGVGTALMTEAARILRRR